MARGQLAAGAATAAVALAASLWLLAPDVRVDAARGDWRAVTEGLSPAAQGGSFVAGRRAVVHFHDLAGHAGEVRVTLSAREADNPARLRVSREDAALFELEAPTSPTAIAVPVPAGADHVEVRIEAWPARATGKPLYRVREIVLRRPMSVGRVIAQALPALIALAVFAALLRRQGTARAAAWALLAAAGAIGVAMCLVDAPSALRVGPRTWDILSLASLACLWATALASLPSRALRAAAVVGTVGILYLPTLRFGLMNEDFSFVRAWSWADLAGALHGSWFPESGVISGYYRPLVSASFALDAWLWGARTAGYHATNLLVHAANGLLALALLGRLRLPPRAALAGALAFTAHPLGTTAAVWFSERTDGLMAAFYLAALLLVLAPHFTRRHAAAVVGLGALALGCKEMAVTLPLATWLVARVGLDADERRRRRPVLAALCALVAAYVVLWLSLFPERLAGRADPASAWKGFDALRSSAWLWLLPRLYAPVFAPVDYARWWTEPLARLPAALAVIVPGVACLVLARRRSPYAPAALLGLAWPLAMVAPILGVNEVDLYRLGLLIALGFGLWCAALLAHAEPRPWLTPVLGACLALWLAPPAVRTARAWGPGGYVMSLLPGFRNHFGADWWDRLTPQMQRLYYEQFDHLDHARTWVGSPADEPLALTSPH